jgi:hypothetical protein
MLQITTFTGLLGVVFQKKRVFTGTAARTSNPAKPYFVSGMS